MRLVPPPGPERTRALVLALVLAGLVAWVSWPAASVPPAPASAASVPGTPAAATGGVGTADRAGEPVTALPVRVRLDELARDPGPVAVGRNLFRFGERPLPPPPPPSSVQQVAPPPPPPPQPTGPPPVPLRLAGRFEAPDGRVVVTLKDSGSGAIFHAVEGDIVDGRYRLIKVGVQSVVVSYVDGSGQRTIALGGGL